MAEQAVINAFAYLGGHDFTGDINQWSMDGGAEAKVKTTFGSAKLNGGRNEYKMGLKTTALAMSGFTDMSATGQDVELFTAYSARTARVVTIGNDEVEGSPCCMAQQLTGSYTPGGGGAVGELSAFSWNGFGSDSAGGVRGVLLKETGTVSATGATGTGVQIGAVSATQYLYATLHLLGTAGTTITVVLESDDNAGFTSATTRITFGPLTAVGGTWATPVAGSITDTYWRFRVTAITGTWTVAGAAGIQ